MIEYRSDLFAVVIDLSNIGQWGSLLANSHKLRKSVCVDQFGWARPRVSGDFEYDEYDNLGNARYLVVTRDGVSPLALARLMPTTSQYMINTIADRADGFEPPANDDVWELSRLVVSEGEVAERIETIKVLERALGRFATMNSIESFLAWVSKDTLRLLKYTGHPLSEVATLADDEGNPTWIVSFQISEDGTEVEEFRDALLVDEDQTIGKASV